MYIFGVVLITCEWARIYRFYGQYNTLTPTLCHDILRFDENFNFFGVLACIFWQVPVSNQSTFRENQRKALSDDLFSKTLNEQYLARMHMLTVNLYNL